MAPRDLTVLGMDDIDLSAHRAPPLTTVPVPCMPIGAEAGLEPMDLIEKRSLRAILDLPVERVGRRSRAPVPAEPG